MNKESTMTRNLESLRDEIIADLKPTYSLIYISQGDSLTEKQIAMVVSGDTDEMWEENWEWESDSRRAGAEYEADSCTEDIITSWCRQDDADYSELKDDWRSSNERDEVIENIQDRDDGTWARDLANASGRVLCRVTVIDEDDSLSYQQVDPGRLAERLGLEITPENLSVLGEIVDNASPEFSVAMGSLVFAVDVGTLYDLPYDCKVLEITDPHFWLGNPFAGSGWAEKVTGTFTIQREDLQTDKDNFGYGWAATCGGVHTPAFESEIRDLTVYPVETQIVGG